MSAAAAFSIHILRSVQLPISLCDDDRRHDRRQDIRHRHGIQHAVQPEKERQQQRKADAEDDLTHHGEHGGLHRLPHRLQKDKCSFIDAGEHEHTEIDAECLDGKVRVVDALICRAENLNERARKQLDNQQCGKADRSLSRQQFCKQCFDPCVELCAHVETDDRNAPCRHADDHGDDDLKELHHNADDRHGDLREFRLPEDRVRRAVFAGHIVDCRHCRNEGDLRKKTAKPE